MHTLAEQGWINSVPAKRNLMTTHRADNTLGSTLIFKRHRIYSNFSQQRADTVNWLHFYWLVMDSNTTRCQDWPGLCSSGLGSECLCSLCWQVGRVQSRVFVCVCVCVCVCVSCHIQLICQCSGLFLERPELAAQNQAAINLQPHLQDAGGRGGVEERLEQRLMGKKTAPLPEQVTVQSGNSLLNLRRGGDYADLSRIHSMKINKTRSWNFISAVTFGCFFVGGFCMRCQLSVADGR